MSKQNPLLYSRQTTEHQLYFQTQVSKSNLSKNAKLNAYKHHFGITLSAQGIIGKYQYTEEEFLELATRNGFRKDSIYNLIFIAPELYHFEGAVLTLVHLKQSFDFMADSIKKGSVGGQMKAYNTKVKAYEDSKVVETEAEPTGTEVDAMINDLTSPDGYNSQFDGYKSQYHKDYIEKHSSKHAKLMLDPITVPFENIPEAILKPSKSTSNKLTEANDYTTQEIIKESLEEFQIAMSNQPEKKPKYKDNPTSKILDTEDIINQLTITKKEKKMPTQYAKKSEIKGTTDFIGKVADGSTKGEQIYNFKRECPKKVYDRVVVAETYVTTFTDEMYQSAVDRKLYPHQVVDAINAKAGNNSLIDDSTFKLEKT